MSVTFEIAGRRFCGPTDPVFVIAEAGVNHNGDVALAHRLVDAAVAAGASAVKFQTFNAEALVTEAAPKAAYQDANAPDAKSQLEMLRALELSHDDFRALQKHCDASGIVFLSTPFEAASADFLNAIGVPAFKLPSGEITNLPLIAHVAAMGRPMILSTGMSTMEDVKLALAEIEAANNRETVILHCLSQYPADPAEVNLRAIATLSDAFGYPVGFSDHTEGIDVTLAATALGARVIEKHFTLDRDLPGPDHRASLTPDELAAMVRGIGTVAAALGDGDKRPRTSERNTAEVARKSIVAARAIEAGETIARADLAVMRPGTGMAPARLGEVVGKRAARAIQRHALIAPEDIA